VDCRATTCGILLVHDPDSDADSREQIRLMGTIRDTLYGTLGFTDRSGVTSFRSSGDFSAIYLLDAGGREQYAGTVPTVPALSGIAGFEIPRGDRPSTLYPPLLLAAQRDNPAWSRPREAQIFDEIPRVAGDRLTEVFVECRSSTCGIVLAYPIDANRIDSIIGDELADSLGFPRSAVGWYETPGGSFAAIYLFTGPPMRLAF